MDIDYAIRKDEPSALSATNTKAKIELYDKWERSNRLSIMFIKTISRLVFAVLLRNTKRSGT